MTLAPGELRLHDAVRTFQLRGDRGRSLKELVLRRHADIPTVTALDHVSVAIDGGERVGIIGRNGAGKSSTLRVLAGIIPLHSGRAEAGGRVAALLELGAGFGREFSGRENIALSGALYGLSRAEVASRTDAIVAFSELGEFIEAPVKAYSAGMLVRLGFSIAAFLEPDVMLIDEVLAVGDAGFQRKCHDRLAERIAAGMTLVFVSHDADAIRFACDRVIVLDAGRVTFDGATEEALAFYNTSFEQGRPWTVRAAS